MYLYQLTTTTAFSFSDICIDQSIDKRFTTHIPEVTQARANLRAVLKQCKRAEHGQKDYLLLVKLLEDYIPQLRALLACVAYDQIGLKSDPVFTWRTPLSAHLLPAAPRFALNGLHADLAFALLTHAAALSNLARATVSSLGAYEHDRTAAETERKAKDDQLTTATVFLCRASGVYTYIADTLLPEWDTHNGGMSEKPPDLSRDVNTALAKMSLADAQSLAIRKLLSKSAADSAVAPGPPLPRSHPSPALIAKLHLDASALYSSARALAKTASPSTSALRISARSPAAEGGGGGGEVSADLRHYLADEAAFHFALAHKWLGVDAGEQGGPSRAGEAVAFVAWARRELEELKDAKGLGSIVGKGKEEREKRERWRAKVGRELESVGVFWKHYRKMNDSLHFQPVPTQADLQARIPAGRMAVAARPYVPPVPAFGPGSAEDVRSHAEALDLAESPGEGASGESQTQGTYVGAGAYF